MSPYGSGVRRALLTRASAVAAVLTACLALIVSPPASASASNQVPASPVHASLVGFNAGNIISDEVFTARDTMTEAQIQEGLNEVLAGRTAIVIAHRLVTVGHADRIIVMRQGQIVEEGNHIQLIASGGHYAELYDTYFRHQSPNYRPEQPPHRELPALAT